MQNKAPKNYIAHKGFTLIELLVVIAIIGVLSAIVLASLNTARSKGNDGAIKSNLDSVRTQSVLFYDQNNGWSSGGASTITAASPITAPTTAICNAAAGANVNVFNDPQIVKAMQAADKAAGGNANPTANTQPNTLKVLCSTDGALSGAKPTFWSITGPLTASSNWWCVDSTGNAKLEAASTLSATGACL